jgi:hypothetical protein
MALTMALVIVFMFILIFAIPAAFEIGYKSGRENALKQVASEIPQGLTLEQLGWLKNQETRR